jgi:glucosamine kinase
VSAAPLYLGVDGGATRCRARLRDADGKLLAEAVGAAANIHVDFDASTAVMHGLIDELLAKAERSEAARGRIAVGFGLAGISDASDEARIVSAFPGFRLVRAANDSATACIGAHAGADGGLVNAGTGTVAIARVAGKETIIGGRGFVLGDDGSAARIGLQALRAAVLAFDRLGPASGLTQEVLGEFGSDPVAMLRWSRDAKPGDFGAFSPRVFDRAAAGDPIALAIVGEAARAVEALTRVVVALGAERVALVGGVGEALRPYFDPDIAARLKPPLYDPTDGAILFVGGAVASQREVAR